MESKLKGHTSPAQIGDWVSMQPNDFIDGADFF